MTDTKNKSKTQADKDESEFELPEFHVDPELDDAGRLQVIMERFVKYRLPLIIEMRDEVESGGRLSDGEIELLDRFISRGPGFHRFVHEYPEYEELVAKLIDLVGDITNKAIDNENAGPS